VAEGKPANSGPEGSVQAPREATRPDPVDNSAPARFNQAVSAALRRFRSSLKIDRTMKRHLVAGAMVLAAIPANAQSRVILFIGDGVGVSHWTAARFAADNLAVNQFKVMGLVDTRASNTRVTDSAAGATAYSAGVRTFNGAIGVAPDSQPVETVLEVAKKRGWATGLVATTSVTHATPASFAAHVPSRASEFDIAKQMADLGPEVMLGGGVRYFSADARPDGTDLIAQLRTTHRVITVADSLAAIPAEGTPRLVGLFGFTQMPHAAQRRPTLPEMTRKAIDILSRDQDGFFLMVEGSQPDWRSHENAPIEQVVAEMLDFDAAIGVALEYQRRQPDVLIVVVSDHETGGLAIEVARDSVVLAQAASSLNDATAALARAMGVVSGGAADSLRATGTGMVDAADALRRHARGARNERLVGDYTTTGHTGQMIPLFASGPGAERFAGIIDNHRVGQLLLEIARQPASSRREEPR
jgi:alkaline phosphatase